MTSKREATDSAWNTAMERAAIYLAVTHGAALLAIASLLPAALEKNGLAQILYPIATFVFAGFLLAMIGFHTAILAEYRQRRLLSSVFDNALDIILQTSLVLSVILVAAAGLYLVLAFRTAGAT